MQTYRWVYSIQRYANINHERNILQSGLLSDFSLFLWITPPSTALGSDSANTVLLQNGERGGCCTLCACMCVRRLPVRSVSWATLERCSSCYGPKAEFTQLPNTNFARGHQIPTSVRDSFTASCQTSESATFSRRDKALHISCRRNSDPTRPSSASPQSKQSFTL